MNRHDKRFYGILAGSLASAGLLVYYAFTHKARYVPGSSDQVRLFTMAAKKAGLPAAWGASPGLANILRRESDGWVGRVNFTYGDRAKDHSAWPGVWAELRRDIRPTRSSATGLGQLLIANVDQYYPSGRAGIGVPMDEAVGMLRYIKDRYGDPETAWKKYGTLFAGY